MAIKVVYDASAVDSAEVLACRRAEITAGEQARVTGEVALRLWLVDDRLALLPACQSQPEAGGLLVIHPSPILDALSVLFEKTWADAIPVSLGTGACPDGVVVPFGDATTRAVFGLLAAGLTDQAIVRRLECSERTVQRHVRKITNAVGATSRFQAALQIGRPAGPPDRGRVRTRACHTRYPSRPMRPPC